MVSSFNSPDCRKVQKFTLGSLPAPIASRSSGFARGSSGMALLKLSNTDMSGFPAGRGCGFSVVKKEKKNPLNGLSFAPGPGKRQSVKRVFLFLFHHGK